MAKTKISEFSSTASNNTDIDGISIAEGMAPSNVNNAIRELMSQLKDWQSGAVVQDMSVNGAFTATGNAVLSADLSVGDDLTVTGDATVGGGFTCTGAAVLSSTLAVTSNATIGGNASITGTLAATGATSLGAITCSGAAVLSSTLAVDGATNLKSGVTLGTSTSNTVTLNALLSSGGGTGTSGQVLKSNGTASAPSWATPITSDTAVASTSGTAINFLLSADVASYVKKITIVFQAVSLSGTANPVVRLGTSSGVVSTGYSGSYSYFTSGGIASVANTTGLVIFDMNTSTDAFSGTVTITKLSGNSWVMSSVVGSSVPRGTIAGSSITLSDSLDRIQITNTASDTFDAGSINVLYE
jgi:hypothetical protein